MTRSYRAGSALLALALLPHLAFAQESKRTEGVPETDIFSLASAAGMVYAASSDRIYAGTGSDALWQEATPLPAGSAGVTTLLAYEDNLYAGTSGSGVFVSRDHGQTWEAFNGNLAGQALHVEALATRGDTLYAGTNGAGVYLIDLRQPVSGWHMFNFGLDGAVVTTLGTGGRALVAVAGQTGGLNVLQRGSTAWTRVPLDPENTQTLALDVAPVGHYLFAATSRGLFRSGLTARHWHRMFGPGEDGGRITALAAHGNRLYAAVEHQGYTIHYSDDAGSTWTFLLGGLGAVYDLHVANDHLWIGLTSGLRHLKLGGLRTAFEAALVIDSQEQPMRRGTVLGALDGTTLRLFGAFYGLPTTWTHIELRRGAPGEEGTPLRTLLFSVIGDVRGGGFDTEYALTEDELQVLHAGLLGIRIRLATPGREIDPLGQLLLKPVDEIAYRETPLTGFAPGQPTTLGRVLTTLEDSRLRITGYFSMQAPWSAMYLTRGAPGEDGTVVANLSQNWFGFPEHATGFDLTVPLTAETLQDLLDDRLGIRVDPLVPSYSLRGLLLASGNTAPAASPITAPSDGTTAFLRGHADPTTPVATVIADPVEDPDGHPVAYYWQASTRPGFLADRTVTKLLGVDSTAVVLTAGTAAALADSLTGGLPDGASVVVYHRMLTTDGALFTAGPASTLILVNQAATPNEPGDGLPDAFRLLGNYPNPFNPATSITIDVPEPSDVTVEVYDMTGRRALATATRSMAAGSGGRIEIDGAALASGTYVYRVVARSATQVWTGQGRMTLVK